MMKRIAFMTSLLLLVCTMTEISAQTRADTSFKGSTAITAHLLRLKAPQPGLRPSDLELRLDLNFDLDADALKPRARAQLDTLAKVLQEPDFSNTSLELAGHTCDIGSEAYNLDLSERRVKSAIDYLASVHHIAPQRLSWRAYGESLPLIVGAKSEEDRGVNRRVVAYLPENRTDLEKMLREMPIADGFRWGVFRYERGGRASLVAYDGSSVLHSNDEYRIFLRPARTKYVYLYQQDSKGNAQWIWPSRQMGFSNPLRAGEYYLPSKREVFALDATVGTETLHLVVTDDRVPELEALVGHRDSQVISQTISQTVLVRGLQEVRTGNAPQAENANIRSQTFEVMSPEEEARMRSRERRADFYQSGKQDVLTVMAQHREFYMRLSFGHE